MARFLSPLFKATALGKYPYPVVSLTDLIVSEGVGVASMAVSISQPSPYTAHIQYTTSDDSATAGVDYTAKAGTVTIPAGDSSVTVDIPITDRPGIQGPRSFQMILDDPRDCVIGNGVADVTIQDIGELSIDSPAVSEDSGPLVFTVTRSAPITGTCSVDYATSDGTATAGVDYSATSGTLDFADGEASKTIEVPVFDDSVFEGHETMFMTLDNPVDCRISDSTGTGTISEDEAPPVVSVDQTSRTVGEDAGTMQVQVNVVGAHDVDVEVSVDYALNDGTASAGTDYTDKSGTLTWTAGDTSPKTVDIDITDRSGIQGDRDFTFDLSNPSDCTIGDSQSTITIRDKTIDLVAAESLHNSVTVARNTIAWQFNDSGNVEQVAADTARFTHDPATNELLNLLVQKQWTNELRDPRDLSTAEWNPSGVAVAKDAVGMDGVANSAHTLTDNQTSGYNHIDQIRAVPDDGNPDTIAYGIGKTSGATNMPQFRLRLLGGTALTESVGFNTNDGSVGEIEADGSYEVRDAGDFWILVLTLVNNNSGNTELRYEIAPARVTAGNLTSEDQSLTGSVVYDFGGIFLNSDFAPSTPIHDPSVSGAAVTQSADDITSTIGSDFNTSEFAYVIEAIMPPVNPGDVNTLYSIDSTNTGVFAIQLEGSAGSNTIQQRVPGTSRVGVGTVPFGSKFRYAVTYTGTDYRVSLNGGPVIALAESAETDGPTGFIGNRLGATDTEYNSTINLIRQVPRALSDAELQAESTL